VYVGGLRHGTQSEDVAEFFQQFGEVAHVKLIYQHETQEFRGFGFVTFHSHYDAEEAAEDANGGEILGKRIRCNIAKYNKSQPGRAPPIRDERCAFDELSCMPARSAAAEWPAVSCMYLTGRQNAGPQKHCGPNAEC
jgi:RNA recognition motif-containing protein